jgi:Clustered mitochondria/Phorbol esters/diacylglycerol binding domain (C1 domain)
MPIEERAKRRGEEEEDDEAVDSFFDGPEALAARARVLETRERGRVSGYRDDFEYSASGTPSPDFLPPLSSLPEGFGGSVLSSAVAAGYVDDDSPGADSPPARGGRRSGASGEDGYVDPSAPTSPQEGGFYVADTKPGTNSPSPSRRSTGEGGYVDDGSPPTSPTRRIRAGDTGEGGYLDDGSPRGRSPPSQPGLVSGEGGYVFNASPSPGSPSNARSDSLPSTKVEEAEVEPLWTAADERIELKHIRTLERIAASLRGKEEAGDTTTPSFRDLRVRLEEEARATERRLSERKRKRLAQTEAALDGVGFPFDWNNAFQQSSQGERSSAELGPLCRDFVYFAKLFGKIIIAEKNLAVRHKSIRPVNVGGVAGGEKFVVHGILFKFATDISGIYGNSDAAAAKAASHELLAVNRLFGRQGLSTPVMSLITHKGFRLIAMTRLPIRGSETLVYGSRDAGRTVHASDPVMNELCREIGSSLNLKEHTGGVDRGGCQAAKLSFPADIEGHVGADGKRYLLDFSRVFPPECPEFYPGVKGSVFYQQLRPEFVRRWHVPLSSDAFTNFGAVGKIEHNAEVAAASDYVRTRGVELFCQHILSQYRRKFAVLNQSVETSNERVEEMLARQRVASDTIPLDQSAASSAKNASISFFSRSSPHEFELTHLKRRTYCDHCAGSLWSLTRQQGFQCRACQFVAHK